jgi:hypothetical protein
MPNAQFELSSVGTVVAVAQVPAQPISANAMSEVGCSCRPHFVSRAGTRRELKQVTAHKTGTTYSLQSRHLDVPSPAVSQ